MTKETLKKPNELIAVKAGRNNYFISEDLATFLNPKYLTEKKTANDSRLESSLTLFKFNESNLLLNTK